MDEFVVKTLSDLVEFIKGASPALWAIARQQVLVDMVSCLLWLAISIGAVCACVTWFKWARKKAVEEDISRTARENYWFATWVAIVIGGIFTLIALLLLSTSIRMKINPDYYAIRVLSEMLP